MTSAKFHRICQRVADTVNREQQIRVGAVTVEQVACVVAGTERTVSHPIISAIRSELLRLGVEIHEA